MPGRLVRPVQILQDRDHRTELGCLAEDRRDRLEQLQLVVVRGVVGGEFGKQVAQRPSSRAGVIGERVRPDHRLQGSEQSDDGRVGEALTTPRDALPPDGDRLSGSWSRDPHEILDQAGLPDPGVGADQDQPAAGVVEPLEQADQLRQLVGPADHRAGRLLRADCHDLMVPHRSDAALPFSIGRAAGAPAGRSVLLAERNNRRDAGRQGLPHPSPGRLSERADRPGSSPGSARCVAPTPDQG